MFNPSLQAKPVTSWQELTLLERSAVEDTGFQAMDWDALPRVDYRAVHFRQLAVSEPAKLAEQPHEFVANDYQQAAKVDAQFEADSAAVDDSNLATALPDTSLLSADSPALSEVVDMTESTRSMEECASEVSDIPVVDPEIEPTIEPEAEPERESESGSEAQDQAMNSESWQQACDEAYQQGLQEGREQAHLQAQSELETALANAQTAAAAELEKALDAQRQSLEQRTAEERALLREVTQRLEACIENSAQFFEPLKRLAMHIAEQLVLAELNVSGNAIERLVQRCLDELNLHGTHSIAVELNPQDKARLEEKAGDLLKQIQLLAVAGLQPGSVRVLVNDTQVEDLVQHRLEALAHALLGQPEAWREKSPFFKQPLSQRDSEVQDAVQALSFADPDAEDVLNA